MGRTAGISWWPLEPRVDAGVKELNEMTIGRTDDPENLFGAPAFEAAHVFGFGSRIPSGPAVMVPRPQGRTHDRNRPARQNSYFSSCIRAAVHTCTNAPWIGIDEYRARVTRDADPGIPTLMQARSEYAQLQ